MSSGSQKNIQYKKEGGVHKKEGRIQGPVQAIGQARLYKRAACTYKFLNIKHSSICCYKTSLESGGSSML